MAAQTKRPGAHIALLRGVNVGGKHKLPMKRLSAIFTELGAEDVRTYIQSGNVVYRASAALAKSLPQAAADAIEAAFGFPVPVISRRASQLRQIVAANPYLERSDDPKQLHVAFLAKRPTAKAAASLDPERSPPDRFTLVGGEIYLYCPKGLARTKLSSAYFDARLGTITTMRNWRTVNKLLELVEA